MFGSSSKGKFDSQQFRNQYDQLGKKYEDLNNERRPVLENYEKMAQQQLSSMIGQSAPAAKDMYDAAHGGNDIYNKQSLPAYSKYISDAQNYDTPEKRQQAAGSAMTDVQAAGQASRDQAMSQLESYGIDPSQTRGAALDQNLRLSTALAQAKAGKDAADKVEQTGHDRQTDALSASAQLANTSMQQNQQAQAMGLNNTTAVNNTATTYGNIFGTPASTLAAQGGIIGAKAQLKQAEQASKAGAAGGGQGAAIGSALGTAAGAVIGTYVLPGIGTMGGAAIGGALGGAAGGAVSKTG